MRVGLLADTHDRVPAVAELVRRLAAAGVGMVMHAGDYCSPFVLEPLEASQVSLAGIFGRNDGDHQGLLAKAAAGFGAEIYESPHSFEVGGQRILLVHDLADANRRSLETHSIVVHGCSHHQQSARRGDTLLVNPGEACGWMHGVPQAAVLDLDTQQLEFISLEGPEWRF
jgi:putative phosphoesterase